MNSIQEETRASAASEGSIESGTWLKKSRMACNRSRGGYEVCSGLAISIIAGVVVLSLP